jgi:hypothetical protein
VAGFVVVVCWRADLNRSVSLVRIPGIRDRTDHLVGQEVLRIPSVVSSSISRDHRGAPTLRALRQEE